MKTLGKIGILGLGRTAQSMAAYLMKKGCEVILWGRNKDALEDIKLKGIKIFGCIDGQFFPNTEADLSLLCNMSDYLFVMTTSEGHKKIAESLKGKLKINQRIIIFNGNWGTYEFYNILGEELYEKHIIIGETGGMIFISDFDKGMCHVKSIKNNMSFATFPKGYCEEVIEDLGDILPQLVPEENVVVTSINNSNPIIHVPLVLFNYTRIENGEDFGFYSDGATSSTIGYIEAIDNERKQIAESLGVKFQSCLSIINSFWTDKKDTLYDAITQNSTYLSVRGPKTLKHRYLSEDLPYGIVPLISLGKVIGIEAKYMKSMVEILNYLLELPEHKEIAFSTTESIYKLIHTENY